MAYLGQTPAVLSFINFPQKHMIYHDFPVNQLHDDGIILIHKPLHWTSFDVVKKTRTLLKNKKTGHAGTLDPLAEGLVILCTGKATKLIEHIQAEHKTYEGTFVLGATTPSYDLETPVTPVSHAVIPSPETIKKAASSMIGDIQQIPPIFSAVKIKGKRAYEYARKGEHTELKKREVSIYTFEVIPIDATTIDFTIVCSKGTYIRTVAHDIGQLLGCGAYLKRLVRTAIGPFELSQSFSIPSLIENMQQHDTPLS
jgi:tRNA pseudouridine55 synthase